MDTNSLSEYFGQIDIYLFDQLLKGRFQPGMRILDAGCGTGRNLVFFLRNAYDVFAVDQDAHAVKNVRRLAQTLNSSLTEEHFRVAPIENLPFADHYFDAVLSSAVLHFARDTSHFTTMLQEMWRVLKPGGLFFARLASDIGIEDRVRPLGERRFRLPDGSTRFLVNEPMLLDQARELGGALIEPIKTTNVQNLRCMTTWCMQRE